MTAKAAKASKKSPSRGSSKSSSKGSKTSSKTAAKKSSRTAAKTAAKKPAASPEEYIDALEEPRRSEIKKLDALIRKTVPKLEPYIESGMLGYGRYHYTYESGREGDWCLIGLASRKQYISLYVTATTPDGTGYLAESYQDRLPKADIGKSCIRVRRAEDLDPKALRALLRDAAKSSTSA